MYRNCYHSQGWIFKVIPFSVLHLAVAIREVETSTGQIRFSKETYQTGNILELGCDGYLCFFYKIYLLK